MGFSLIDSEFANLKEILKPYSNLINDDFEKRLKKAMGNLHFSYLRGAIKECEKNLAKYPCDNLFARIMYFYDKRQNLHKDKSLLLHCFEIALRSTLAVKQQICLTPQQMTGIKKPQYPKNTKNPNNSKR